MIVVMLSLAGCVSLDSDKNHQEILTAIQNSEDKIDLRISSLETKLKKQTTNIKRLDREIVTLQKRVKKLNSFSYLGNNRQRVKITSAKGLTLKNKITLGSIEKVTIDEISKTLDARVDTGARTSSINADDIEKFERDGVEWVRFHIASDKEKKQWIQAPILRNVKIRQSTRDVAEKRFVIKLWVTVGNIRENTEFTLANRSQMTHPVLLGREFIKDIALVDVSKQFIHTKNVSKIQ